MLLRCNASLQAIPSDYLAWLSHFSLYIEREI